MQQALQKNTDLADSLAAAFDSARGSISAFFDSLSASSLSSGEASPWQKLQDLSAEGITISIDLDFKNAQDALDSFLETAEEPIPLSADASAVETAGSDAVTKLVTLCADTQLALQGDASAVVSAGSAALDALKALYSSTVLTVKATVVTDGTPTGGTPTGNPTGGGENGTPTGGQTHGPKVPGSPFQRLLGAATGGRFASPTRTEIAEDGDPEYVIPVKKESLALPLLRQLIGELSGSARDALRRDLGENSPALSGLPSLLSSARAAAAPVITQNQTNSVQAPVTIEVHAEGSSPEEIGRSIYDVAERYLLRTLADLSVL